MEKREKLTRENVMRIASLAKLRLEENEVDKYTAQFNEILQYVEQLSELDTEDVEPLSHVMEITNVLRKDVPEESLQREDALKNAPETDGEQFIVPKVIDKST